METLLKERINYEYFAEINNAKDPIERIFSESKSLLEIETKLAELKDSLQKRYPGYVDFTYKYRYTTPSNGCYSAWFDLYGIR